MSIMKNGVSGSRLRAARLRRTPILAVMLAMAAPLWGQDVTRAQKPAHSLTPEEREQFESVIKDYLMRNPAIIKEAIQALQARAGAAAAGKAAQSLAAERAELFNDPSPQYLGSESPDVTIVEFFDYRCGYCKQIAPTLQKLVDNDPKVRVVLKELPILGADSLYAA